MARVDFSKDSVEEKMAGVFDLELNEGHSLDAESDEDAIDIDPMRTVSVDLFAHLLHYPFFHSRNLNPISSHLWKM